MFLFLLTRNWAWLLILSLRLVFCHVYPSWPLHSRFCIHLFIYLWIYLFAKNWSYKLTFSQKILTVKGTEMSLMSLMSWGAGVVQWWEHSPPTNLARVRFPDSASYVGWVCWFSTLHREVFSGYSGFPSPQKPTFDLIYFHCSFQFTVSPISALALEWLDT